MKLLTIPLLASALVLTSTLAVRSYATPPPYSGDGEWYPTAGWINVTGKPNKDYIRINGMLQYQGEANYYMGSVVIKVGDITAMRKSYGMTLPSMTPPAPPPSPDQDAAVVTIKLEHDPHSLNVYVSRNAEGFVQQFTGWMTGEEIKKYQ